MAPCVWPGDANEDLVVSNLDLLEVGLKYGKTGQARSTHSNLWNGYNCQNWNDTLSNGKNTKYADCNGDGTINMNDTLAINLNYSLTHSSRLTNQPIIQTTNPDVYFNFNKNLYYPGDTVLASVYIGNSLNLQSNFYGAAFTINYDNTKAKYGSTHFYFNNSWVGNINQRQIKFSYLNTSAGTVDASIVRITHTDTTGYGKVATLRFILKDTLVGNELYFTINNGIKTNHTGTYSNLNTGTDSVALVNNITSINQLKGITNELNIYPNPNNGSFIIETNTITKQILQVFDVNGKMVLSQTVNGTTSIDAGILTQGVYNLSLISSTGVVNKRLVIVR